MQTLKKHIFIHRYFMWVMLGISLNGYSALLPKINKAKPQALITVFIHGIMSIKPHVSINNFIRFLEDDVENTIYSKSIEYMRQDEFFYRNQAMQQIGLIEIDTKRVEPGNSSGALARIIESMEDELPHRPQEKRYYYTYGWSGLLSAKRRYQDAKDFFIALEKVSQSFKSQGIQPRFRLIAYSHGGNVALNLACIRRKEFPTSTLKINELIMVGTPVQPQTDFLIDDPLFGHIYHLFSLKDRVQSIDFISSQCLFSDNIFRSKRNAKLPKNLIQIEVQVKRAAAFVYKNPKKLVLANDLSKRSIVLGTSKLLRDASPGHAELWFFGWTPMHYRPCFPLYPLPIIAFLPYIMSEVNHIRDQLSPNTPVVVDFRPDQLSMIVRGTNQFPPYHVVSLMSAQKYKQLIKQVMVYKPECYTNAAYDLQIKKAVYRAKEFYKIHEESRRKELIRKGTRKCTPEKKKLSSYLREISFDIY